MWNTELLNDSSRDEITQQMSRCSIKTRICYLDCDVPVCFGHILGDTASEACPFEEANKGARFSVCFVRSEREKHSGAAREIVCQGPAPPPTRAETSKRGLYLGVRPTKALC